jgi:hypothetical protein
VECVIGSGNGGEKFKRRTLLGSEARGTREDEYLPLAFVPSGLRSRIDEETFSLHFRLTLSS